jgi:hypothetical protein
VTDPHGTSPRPGAPFVERASFGPTTGLFTGVLGLVVVALVVVITLVEDRTVVGLRVIFATLAVGVVVWCYLLRPRIILQADSVLLRNAVVDHDIAYAATDDVVIRTITRVYVGDKTYPGLGVGHPARKLMRNQTRDSTPLAATTAITGKLLADALPDFVQDQILERMTLARQDPGASRRVVTRPAWLEIGILVVCALGFLAALSF